MRISNTKFFIALAAIILGLISCFSPSEINDIPDKLKAGLLNPERSINFDISEFTDICLIPEYKTAQTFVAKFEKEISWDRYISELEFGIILFSDDEVFYRKIKSHKTNVFLVTGACWNTRIGSLTLSRAPTIDNEIYWNLEFREYQQ